MKERREVDGILASLPLDTKKSNGVGFLTPTVTLSQSFNFNTKKQGIH